MIRHFCDICDKELSPGDTYRPSAFQYYKLSKVSYRYDYKAEYETASAEICNDCLKAIVDEAKRRNVI